MKAPRQPDGQVNQSRLQQLSIPLALTAVSSLVLVFLSAFLIVDPDLFHEMALARAAIERGAVPTGDLFAFTPTVSPLVHHEWGTGMVLYWVVTRFGAAGLLTLKYLLAVALALLTVKAARLRGTRWELLCMMAPVGLCMADLGFTNVRAQFFSLVASAVLLVMIEVDRRGSRLWIAPWLLVHVIWLNMHGGFVIGFALLGCHWVEQVSQTRTARWHLPACALAMGLLTFVNPYGVHYPRYLWNALVMPRTSITEWQRVWASPSLTAVFILSLLVVAYAWSQLGAKRMPGLLSVTVFAIAAFLHIRHLSFYALVWMVYVPAWVGVTAAGRRLLSTWREFPELVIAAALPAILVGLGFSVSCEPWRLRVPANQQDLDEGSSIVYPVGAVRYLRDHRFNGNLMTAFDVGSYVSWKLYPAVKVGMDGRYEVAYRSGVFEEVLSFYAGLRGWSGTLEKYHPDMILVASTDPVRSLLQARTDWSLAYKDDVFMLFARPGLVFPFVDAGGERIESEFP